MCERINVVVDTEQAKTELDGVKQDTQETEEIVDTVTNNARAINALTRDQTILVATRAWTSTRSLFKMMGITMDANFASLISIGLATVQMYSSLAGIAASNPLTWTHSVLFWSQAAAATLSITASIGARVAAIQQQQKQQQLVNSIGDRYY